MYMCTIGNVVALLCIFCSLELSAAPNIFVYKMYKMEVLSQIQT
jgi:hypothetical protein